MRRIYKSAKKEPSVRAAPSRLYAPFKGYTMAEVANQAGHASERTPVVYANTNREKRRRSQICFKDSSGAIIMWKII